MPRIPVYEQTQATIGNLPSPSINPVMPDAGAGIREGVQDMMRTITKAREEANALRVEDAVNRLNKDDNTLLYGDNDPTNPNAERGAFSVKGKDAFDRGDNPPLADEYLRKYDALVAEISKSLGNDDQRVRFSVVAGRMRANFDSQVRRHEQMQGEVYREDVYKGTVATELEKAARNYTDPIALQDSMTRIVEATRLYGSAQGMSKNSIDQMVLDATSDMHTVVINRLLEEQKPLAAQEYYALHRNAINKRDAGAAIKALGVVGIDAQVSAYVDELVGGPLGPQGNDRQAFQIDKMADLVRKKYKDNPQALDAAIKQLVERKRLHDAGVAERKAADNGQIARVAASIAFSKFRPKNDYGAFDLEQAVNDLKDAKLYPELAGKPDLLKAAETQLKDLYNLWKLSVNERDRERLGKIWTEVNKHKSPTSALAAVRKMNEWKQLDGTAQRTLTGQIENELHPPVVSAASKEKIKEAQDAKYFELTRDPARLAAMTEPEIMAMTPELGAANVEKAIKEKRRLATAAETVTIDKNHLHQRAKFAGMNVDNPTTKEKALLGDLWKRAQEIIYATQKGAMRPLDRKEKEKIFDTLLLIVPVRMKGGIFGDDSISYENKRLFQVKDVGNVGRPGDRQKVIESFRAKGIEPDEDQILRGIAAMNKK